MDEIKNERFGGNLNTDWNFPKRTYFENHQWGKNLYENEKVNKKKKSVLKRFESPWKRKINFLELDSDEESDDDSWNSIFQTNIDNQLSKRRCKEMLTRIIKAMNKMTAQKEKVLEELSKVEITSTTGFVFKMVNNGTQRRNKNS